jgi:hypothetical protein
MDRKITPGYTPLRSFGLTSLLAALAILAALDIGYLTHLVGYLVLMIALGVLAVIYMACDKAIFALNAAAFMIILFFASGKSVTIALFGAILVLGALLLSVAVGKKSAKTSAVLTVGVTVSLCYILVSLLMYAAQGNSLAISDLFDKLNGAFDSIKVLMADLIRDSVNALSEEMMAYYAKYEITREMLLETSLMTMESFLDMAQLLLPGCFLFLVQFMAYIGVSAFEKTARIFRCDVILPEPRWRLYPTQISCIIYILVTSAYLLSGLFASASTFLILMMNFWIALMPVMIACGFNGLIMRLKHPRFRKSMIFILVLFAAGCLFMTETALSLGIFMLTFMGAQDVSLARTAEAAERKNRDAG